MCKQFFSHSSPPDYNTIKVMDARRSRSCSVFEMSQSSIDRLQSKLEKAEKVRYHIFVFLQL